METVRTVHRSSAISTYAYLDNSLRKCYFGDDESVESEEFVETFDFHSVMLENANNSFLT